MDLIAGGDDLTPEARTVAARLIESRGEISRPFQLLLHSPALAGRVAELGQLVRSGSSLGDADRELVTLATGRAIGCAFVWESHLDAAAAAGVSPDTIATLQGDHTDGLGEREGILVSFVEQLCETRTVSNETFEAARGLIGVRGVIELSLTIGYYAMLGIRHGCVRRVLRAAGRADPRPFRDSGARVDRIEDDHADGLLQEVGDLPAVLDVVLRGPVRLQSPRASIALEQVERTAGIALLVEVVALAAGLGPRALHHPRQQGAEGVLVPGARSEGREDGHWVLGHAHLVGARRFVGTGTPPGHSRTGAVYRPPSLAEEEG